MFWTSALSEYNAYETIRRVEDTLIHFELRPLFREKTLVHEAQDIPPKSMVLVVSSHHI